MGETSSYNWPFVSIIFPIRNEEEFIGRSLKFVLEQDYPPDKFEIIVVDGRSDDNTRKIVEDIASNDDRVKLLDNPNYLSSSARNIGARAAVGEIITFIDGHVYIDNDQLLKNTAKLMTENDVYVLSRPQFLETPDNTFFQKAVSLARKSSFGHGIGSTIYLKEDRFVDPASSGASYRKEVFEKVGYFDENFDAAEDYDFNYRIGRAGLKSFTSIKLAVNYYPRSNFKGLFKQMNRYGIGRLRFFKKHNSGWASGIVILELYLLILLALGILSLYSARWCPVFFFTLSLYLAANLISSLIVSIRNGIKYLPLYPFIYITIHSGLAWGFFTALFKKR